MIVTVSRRRPLARSLAVFFLASVVFLLFGGLSSAQALQNKAFGTILVEEGEVAEDGVSASVGNIEVLGEVDGDVKTAYGNIMVYGPVDGDVRSGVGNIRVEAEVDGEVEAGFGNVYINDEVEGDVSVERGNIELGPEAVVEGEIYHGSGDFSAARTAQFDGTMVGMASDFDDDSDGSPGGSDLLGFIGWIFAAALFAAASVLAAVIAPRPLAASSRQVGKAPVSSMLAGLGSVVAALVVSVILLVSGVGIPILVLLAPAYLIFVLFGAIVVAFFVGRKVVLAIGRHRSGDSLAAIVGAVILAAVYFLPLGFFLFCLVSLFGAGAALMAMFAKRRPRPFSYEPYGRERREF